MLIILIFCAGLTAMYVLLMVIYRIGWDAQPIFSPPADFVPAARISVIVPARNESLNIEACLQSLIGQQYPQELLEIILVDDHSEDDTADKARVVHPGIKILDLALLPGEGGQHNSYKKMALTAGISESSGELIVTTDADCVAPPGWLEHLAAIYEQRHPAMIIGPVAFTDTGSINGIFQLLDFTTMQGITAAAHRFRLGGMANGANLAFSRAAFDAVGGYSGVDHFASGDDYLLLHKIQRQFPDRISYLKSQAAIVRTPPQPDWAGFLQQRIRWASKSGKYSDHMLTGILGLVYLFNVCLLAAGLAALLIQGFWQVAAGMLMAKIACELFFLAPVARFFDHQRRLWMFPLLQPMHIVYIVVAGFLGMIGNYSWKGRRVR